MRIINCMISSHIQNVGCVASLNGEDYFLGKSLESVLVTGYYEICPSNKYLCTPNDTISIEIGILAGFESYRQPKLNQY